MKTSINQLLEDYKKTNKKAFIPYITAGFPSLDATFNVIKTLAENGADIIELGVPFSDPLADGPTIQHACEVALEKNVSLNNILELVRKVRSSNINVPIVIFSYFNPVLTFGIENFAKKCSEVGVNGTLLVDLPAENASLIKLELDKHNVETIFLASPTTEKSRLKLIDEMSSGFVYYVSRTGVTGTQDNFSNTLFSEMKEIKNYLKKPICLGFGITNSEQAREVSKIVDGVIIGSALIKVIGQDKNTNEFCEDLADFTKSIVEAIN